MPIASNFVHGVAENSASLRRYAACTIQMRTQAQFSPQQTMHAPKWGNLLQRPHHPKASSVERTVRPKQHGKLAFFLGLTPGELLG